jgi:YhcN/YlaJ family sporulation lipoprotein
MLKFLRGVAVILFSLFFVGCAMDRNQQGAEVNRTRTPANLRGPVTDIPSKYVDRERINRVATPVTPTAPGPTNPTPNIPKRNLDNSYNYNVRAADQIAQHVTKLPEVESSTAIRMGKSAYVGVILRENEELTESLKQKIAKRARRADSGLQNVYVSANPDFQKQLVQYANQLRAGRPIRGMVNQLEDLFKRTFPDAS